MQRCRSEQFLVELLSPQVLYVLLMPRTGWQFWQSGRDLVLASPWLSNLLQKRGHRFGALSLFVNGCHAMFAVIY